MPHNRGTGPVVLSLEKVTAEFDGFKALNGVNLQLRRGEIHFLIGPSGAGKTTMLDVMCGKLKPAQGRIIYPDGREHRIVKIGGSRIYKSPVVSGLTVADNLLLALHPNRGIFAALIVKSDKETRRRLADILETTGLKEHALRRAGGLPPGQRKRLEIGMALAQEPQVLLLDEPVAGMSGAEAEKTGELLVRISGQRAVLAAERDMEFVRRFAGRVTIMHEGRLLLDGTMEEVWRNALAAVAIRGESARAEG
ncbi:ATP-binding cassette domain-containing protein [Paenibacillus humicola]|uniref:ATP-binding cassette domain-containing protein n=1 Tax=Paenibacillus humicola TaxID=3110540 RepID=UPI00237C0143|nr:ATP-binding cassette domain-containing protein [Paenibacillus humicola]